RGTWRGAGEHLHAVAAPPSSWGAACVQPRRAGGVPRGARPSAGEAFRVKLAPAEDPPEDGTSGRAVDLASSACRILARGRAQPSPRRRTAPVIGADAGRDGVRRADRADRFPAVVVARRPPGRIRALPRTSRTRLRHRTRDRT